MSLGRLLAAGKSLAGGHDDAGRYRVNKHVALPKFISPRNPFAPAEKPAAPPLRAETSEQAHGEKPVVVRAKAVANGAGNTSLQAWVAALAARWISEWRRKINPMPRLPKRPGPVKSAVPRFAKTPVQSELSLDKVQVVRNDLSDADFEVVVSKTPVSGQSKLPALLQHEIGSAGNTWDRVTTRIFGVDQT
jgi:hypothetical protein